MDEAMTALLESGKTGGEIYDALCSQSVDLVFTAHPTQAMRGSVRTKYDRMHRDLKKLHVTNMTPSDQSELATDMYASIQAAWCALLNHW
jgi:phosphoenolpyruvate carboxylase